MTKTILHIARVVATCRRQRVSQPADMSAIGLISLIMSARVCYMTCCSVTACVSLCLSVSCPFLSIYLSDMSLSMSLTISPCLCLCATAVSGAGGRHQSREGGLLQVLPRGEGRGAQLARAVRGHRQRPGQDGQVSTTDSARSGSVQTDHTGSDSHSSISGQGERWIPSIAGCVGTVLIHPVIPTVTAGV